MTDRPQSDTLAVALPREMVRVTKIASEYRKVEMGFLAVAIRWRRRPHAVTGEHREASCDPATGRAFGERVSAGGGA